MPQTTQFILITGLSGSGKSLVHNCFEDMGYYCVDNLPIRLIPRFFELIEQGTEHNRVAVVTDVREKSFLTDFIETYLELKKRFHLKLVFLEAADDVLLRRFSETRRPHPFPVKGPLRDAIRLEREQLGRVRDLADVVIDTSRFNVHEVRDYILGKFDPERAATLVVSIVSFGFKHGTPRDADLQFDVRFLPNPHFVPELHGKTGRDPEVMEWVLGNPRTQELLEQLTSFLRYLVPRYIDEGKAYLTIGVGCTGGKHRSVVIANELATALKDPRFSLSVLHRDLERP